MSDSPAKVIFACIHNAGRSQMAAAMFELLADPAKAIGISAGSRPSERVHPEVVEAMRELGMDLSRCKPQKLTDELAQGAALLVTMGCAEACPYVPGLRHVDWLLVDPEGKTMEEVRVIRDQVKCHIEQLVAEKGWKKTAC